MSPPLADSRSLTVIVRIVITVVVVVIITVTIVVVTVSVPGVWGVVAPGRGGGATDEVVQDGAAGGAIRRAGAADLAERDKKQKEEEDEASKKRASSRPKNGPICNIYAILEGMMIPGEWQSSWAWHGKKWTNLDNLADRGSCSSSKWRLKCPFFNRKWWPKSSNETDERQNIRTFYGEKNAPN